MVNENNITNNPEIRTNQQSTAQQSTPAQPSKRVRSPYLFPAYNFNLARQIAERVEVDGAGNLSEATLAISLHLSAASSGFNLKRLTAQQFGLITRQGEVIATTPLAKKILKPTCDEEKQNAMIESFMAIPLFRAVATRFKGQPIPVSSTFRNILEREFGIDSKRIPDAERVLMDSARDTGVLVSSGNSVYISIDKTTVANSTKPIEISDEATSSPQSSQNQPTSQNKTNRTTPNISTGDRILPIINEEDLIELDDSKFKGFWDAYGEILRNRARRNKGEEKDGIK